MTNVHLDCSGCDLRNACMPEACRNLLWFALFRILLYRYEPVDEVTQHQIWLAVVN